MNRRETAVSKFKEGYCCAQSVLFSYAERLNISTDMALKMADGFGAGMGRKQKVCGAISGAILALNLLYGRGENDDEDQHEFAYSKVKDLIDKFEAKNGTATCKELLHGCDLLTPEGQDTFKTQNMIEQCYGYVDDTVAILEELID